MKKSAKLMATALMLSTAITPFAYSNNSGEVKPITRKDEKASQVIVYGVTVSPYVRKVLVALHEKGIAHTVVETLPKSLLKATKAEISKDFEEASGPLGKIPAVTIDGWSISDSSAIAAYLSKIPGGESNLYPSDAKELAQTVWFEKYADEVVAGATRAVLVEKVVKPKILNQKTDQENLNKIMTEQLPVICDYLESKVPANGWIVGKEFTIADIALAAHFISLDVAREKVDETRWPKLVAYLNRVKERPSFVKVMK